MRNFFFLLFCIINSGVYSQTIIKTPWSDMVDHTNPHPEYPEPQLVREKWQSLNGQWDFAILPKGSSPETGFAGKITVPFPVESFLSGVQKPVGPENELWYERSLDLQLNPKGKRILLKFGAVDWEAEVWVNDKNVGKHQGGYDSFSFDITDFLVKGKTQKKFVSVFGIQVTLDHSRGENKSKIQKESGTRR
ncbi:sugar-binding domain-containing protein [Algoriphagus boritolerans]|uniref:sugar-binding domain-containing protein n=1 Tax=Algoriphagus boritolerans TaxID=308111 RepID=UPI000A9079D6